MNAFIGLVKKDMLISRFWYSTWLIFLSLLMVAGSVFASKLNEPGIVVPILVTFLPLHVFFMPFMVYSLLKLEGKTQLWLYNPQSSVKLLLAKISASFIFQFFSQLLVVIYGYMMLKWLVNQGVDGVFPVKAIIFTYVAMLATALLFSIWITFLWTFYHSLGRYPRLKNFRWLVVLLVIIAYNTIETIFIRTKLFENHLFPQSDTMISIAYDGNTGWTMVYEEIPVSILPIIFYTILSLTLFFIASKLLDKKVEV